MPIKDITGQKFNKLITLAPAYINNGRTFWLYRCDCGEQVIKRADCVMSGNTKSCGCQNLASATKHGLRYTKSYSVWQQMMGRCYKQTYHNYCLYGARGITVCDRWHSVTNFFEDMGEPPDGLSIDRINNDGPYSPENCKWSTPKEQQRNRRKTIRVRYAGETKSLAELAEKHHIRYNVVYNRIFNCDWSVHKSLTTPVRKRTIKPGPSR